jgi:2-polyprenyl-3-methyl-5-hydroxy-6-metoxy-1,4-benzoquinol methylase
MSEMPARTQLARLGWLKEQETPLITRLRYPLKRPTDALNSRNLAVRDAILRDIASGEAKTQSLPCCLGGPGDADDLLVSEIDRYGIPLRTVVSRKTGLMRIDPYFDDSYLARFYRDYYRPLHDFTAQDLGNTLADQITKGEWIWARSRAWVRSGGRVLDIGCGLGGMLIPFRMRGYETYGCDFGREFLNYGRTLNPNLIEGDVSKAAGHGPFDLIILSHVLEHATNPIALLTQVRSLLAEGGTFYVEVPNLFDIGRSYNYDLLEYLQGAHPWTFSSQTLGAALLRSGLEVIASDDSGHVCCFTRGVKAVPDAAAAQPERVIRELRSIERRMIQPKKMRWAVSVSRKELKRLSRKMATRRAASSGQQKPIGGAAPREGLRA